MAAEQEPQAEPPGSAWLLRYWPRIATAASLAVFVLAVWFLHGEFAELRVVDVAAELRAIPWSRVVLAMVLAAAAYGLMTLYDGLAMRYIGRDVPYGRTALTSFMAFAVGNNVGIASLSGGAIRYRMYSALGFSGVEISKVIVFCFVTFVLGTGLLLGGALWVIPAQLSLLFGSASWVPRTLGSLLLLCGLGYLVLPFLRTAPISVANWQIEVPRARIAVAQALVAMADLVLTSATLYVLVAAQIDVGFMAFLSIYLVAISAGLLSNIPGGIGVFEAVLLLAFPEVGREGLLSTIIVYRLIYFVGPLVIALVILAGHELITLRRPLRVAGERIADGLSTIAPQFVGAVVFLAGVVLLVSGASPAIEERLHMIGEIVPHGVLEISHMAGSLIGLCLLLLARGLYRRLHSAYRIVSALLVVGAVASLLKGFDYEEAVILSAAALLLWAARREFHRSGSLWDLRFSARWIAVIAIALIGSAWVGFASYRHVPYSSELWWQFSLDGDAPRMLRAMLLVFVGAIAFSILKLMRPAPPSAQAVGRDDMIVVRRIIGSTDMAQANAALIGDKRFLFNPARTAFIMYQISGRSWVALGDPVGPRSEQAALAWQFRELCDRYDGWPVFYEVSQRSLPICVDMGLSLSKLGEEGLVPLSTFSLEGSEHAPLRHARSRAERDGASFAIVPRGRIAELMPQLAAVSEAWLGHKGAQEKGFSLGRFSGEYLENFDCAVVRVADRVVAFANLWPAAAGSELSFDLMRYRPDAPKGVMDYLFVELLLWARSQGYAWFSLGMAPLSGLEHHALAPIWHRVGNLVFEHTEDFYNFEGLRRYKQKFMPEWRPRYLASRGGLALPKIVLDCTALIAGRLTRLV